MRASIAFGLALPLVLGVGSLHAQQRVDRYSIPSQARYQPFQLEGKRPLTRAERTGFSETSLYADVVQFIDSLQVLGADIETGSIGRTSEGRELPYVIASRPLITTPQEARRLGRPVAYIQANIHAGEVEGKEAMLAMLRDLVFDPRPNVLDSIVLIVQPIYNADGNEALGPDNRRSQNGPALAGTRHTAADINLNRDYVGADAPETRASLEMLNRWDPNLFMDLHTTDGSIHGYALTYAPTLMPTAVTVSPYLFDTMMPEIRRRVLDRQGFHINDYGDFSRPRPADAAPGGARGYGWRGVSLETMIADSIPSGWTFQTYTFLPGYGTNYYGLRGRLSILSEAFSHDPFPRRVASTYAFVSEILSYLGEHSGEILALAQKADSSVAAWANDPGSSPPLALQARMDTTRIEDVRVEQIVPLTDSARAEAGMGDRRTHRNHPTGAHAGHGRLHPHAHQHAAVRLRVPRRGRRLAPPHPRRPRRAGGGAHLPRHGHGSGLRRRLHHRQREARDASRAPVGHGWMEQRGVAHPSRRYLRRTRRPAEGAAGVLPPRAGERRRAHVLSQRGDGGGARVSGRQDHGPGVADDATGSMRRSRRAGGTVCTC